MTVRIWLPAVMPFDTWSARPVVSYDTIEDGLVGFWLDDEGLHLRVVDAGAESVVVFGLDEFTGLTVSEQIVENS